MGMRLKLSGKTVYISGQAHQASLGCTTMTPEIIKSSATTMVLSLFLFFWFAPVGTIASITPVQKYVALENQKMMLFEYGQPFKLHKRSRAELYKATVGH
jgi:hypothetical protein